MRRGAFLAGVAAAGAAGAASPEPRVVLRVDAAPLAHDIDPYRDAEVGADELAWLYADGLVGWDGGVTPLLANVPEIRDSGRRYLYALRPARWHDGAPVRSGDVGAALEQVRSSAFGTREPYRSVRSFTIRDDHRFEVELDAARPQFAASFFGARGIPALPLLRHRSDGASVGTGPFAVATRPELGRWRLDRYHGSPRGIPRVDAIELRLLTLETTADLQLRSGEADIALPLSPGAAGSSAYRTVQRFTSAAVLLLNCATAFADASVRRAFAGSIRVAELQRAYDRRRTALYSSVLLTGEDDPGFASALQPQPSAAARLRESLAGRTLTIAYIRGSPAQERTVLLLQQTLHEVGVASDLRGVPGALYQTADGPLRTGRFDIAVYGLAYGDAIDLAADWTCNALPPAGGNFARWCDPRFDAAAARGDVRTMQRRLYDTMACIPLSRAYELLGIGRRVVGFAAPEPLTPATYRCAEWALPPASTSSRSSSGGSASISRRSADV